MVCKIPYNQTNYFSKTVLDYLSQSEEITPFYNHFPTIEIFGKQLKSKSEFSQKKRKILVKVLQEQYKNCAVSEKTKANIELLLQSNTFTITTGHQLNLFTGPLYFLYKIISAINLAEDLKKEYPKYNFVPIYWMATEDHDFDEINFFNFKNKKIQWNCSSKGAVGELPTEGLEKVFLEFAKLLNLGKNANYIKKLFQKTYIQHTNLAETTRFLANELFKEYGLVILDANNSDLKREFSPYIKTELTKQVAYKEVGKTIKSLENNYKIQVNPREINLFYIQKNLRERIIYESDTYKILNTNIQFSELEILQELERFPERFSPNVIMRPLYQEVILPNLCYIGGGGELAYWLELKSYFQSVNVTFPILLLRNSALLISKKQNSKLQKLNISIADLFLNQTELIVKKIKEKSNLELDFSKQKKFLSKQFSNLKELAKKTDKSFIGAVLAQEKKQLKGLEKLEKRLLKAEKRKNTDLVNRIISLQNELFPKQSLQERNANFSEFYLEFGDNLIDKLKENLEPLDFNFTVFIL